jgi:hypothetical protein
MWASSIRRYTFQYLTFYRFARISRQPTSMLLALMGMTSIHAQMYVFRWSITAIKSCWQSSSYRSMIAYWMWTVLLPLRDFDEYNLDWINVRCDCQEDALRPKLPHSMYLSREIYIGPSLEMVDCTA